MTPANPNKRLLGYFAAGVGLTVGYATVRDAGWQGSTFWFTILLSPGTPSTRS